MKIPKLDRHLAWSTTQALLIALGGAGTVAFLATLQAWLIAVSGGFLCLTWAMLYHFLKNLANRPERGTVNVQPE